MHVRVPQLWLGDVICGPPAPLEVKHVLCKRLFWSRAQGLDPELQDQQSATNYDDEDDNAESSGRLMAATLRSRLRIFAMAWAGRNDRAIVQLLLNTCIKVLLE